MFRDYYSILEVDAEATSKEILSAFKKQALKWHPDRNPDIDTTARMQLIIEAKLILCDSEARKKYDVEYARFFNTQTANGGFDRKQTETSHTEDDEAFSAESSGKNTRSFEVQDEELKRWMHNAKKQSADLLQQTIEDFKGMVKSGAKAAVEAGVQAFFAQIILSILFIIIVLLASLCN